jgi:iron-sulfur cluster assembly accessory protein
MTVQLTPRAKEMIETLSNEMGIGHYSIRLLTKGGGCSGLKQDAYFDEIVGDLDDVFTFDGIQVVIDQISHSLLGTFTLDFIDTPFNSGFKFILDNASRTSCGCQESFSPIVQGESNEQSHSETSPNESDTEVSVEQSDELVK